MMPIFWSLGRRKDITKSELIRHNPSQFHSLSVGTTWSDEYDRMTLCSITIEKTPTQDIIDLASQNIAISNIFTAKLLRILR